MSTAGVALRARTIRPRRYLDYTVRTTRFESKKKETKGVKETAQNSQSNHTKTTEQTVTPVKTPLQKMSQPRRESSYSALAISAIKVADPVYEEIVTDDLPVFVEPSSRRKNLLSIVIYGFGMFVLFVSLAASVNTFIVNQNAKEQVQALGQQTYSTDANGVQEGTGSDPAESPVSDNALLSYVPQNPEDPRYIRIPALGVISRVKALGVDASTGTIDAPHNIHDTGWYSESVKPGSGPGTSLLMGHVSGWTAPGVFKKIDTLQEGEMILVENGVGRTFTYRVYKTEKMHVDTIDMNNVLATEKAGEHDIKLMTCSGNFNSETEQYDSRTIVSARQI